MSRNSNNNNNKEEYFTILIDKYMMVINRLIDYLDENDMIPIKMVCMKEIIKEYIKSNRDEIVMNSIEIILKNKDEILNFEFDEDDKQIDNLRSIMESKINIGRNIGRNIGKYEMEIVKMVMEAKSKSKKLGKDKREMIREYVDVMILILERMREIIVS